MPKTRLTPVASLASHVSHELRHKYQLHRRQAEWLCFVYIGTMERSLKTTAFAPKLHEEIASLAYGAWRKALEREYNNL